MTIESKALDVAREWYAGLAAQKDGLPARGIVAAALVVLEQLKDDYDLRIEAHLAKGGAQIRGVSGAAVSKILARFGEHRPFVKEGGRTNRGGPGGVAALLGGLRTAHLSKLDPASRTEVLDAIQSFLVDRVRDYHNRQRLRVDYDPSQSAWQSVRDLLDEARKTGKEGPVAQYLVGAKLQLRFPDIEVGNESYSTADDQLDRPGDFCIEDTAFHVTVAPLPAVYEKCRRNLAEGYRVFLLVTDQWVVGARQNAETVAPGRIMVLSIEAFVAQNLEELSTFSRNELTLGFRRLLDIYNDRVEKVELDKSMLIEIPRNLRSAGQEDQPRGDRT